MMGKQPKKRSQNRDDGAARIFGPFPASFHRLEFHGRGPTLFPHGVLHEVHAGGWNGIRPVGSAVTRFGYWRDPLCLLTVALYGLNRWGIKPWSHSEFIHGQFNDLLLIPAALPLVLWIQRISGLRTSDQPPYLSEISLHLAVWSLVSEGIGPFFFHHGTADLRDVFAYTIGAIAAGLWWHRRAWPIQRVGP